MQRESITHNSNFSQPKHCFWWSPEVRVIHVSLSTFFPSVLPILRPTKQDIRCWVGPLEIKIRQPEEMASAADEPTYYYPGHLTCLPWASHLSRFTVNGKYRRTVAPVINLHLRRARWKFLWLASSSIQYCQSEILVSKYSAVL